VPRSDNLTRSLLLQALGVFAGFAFFVPLSAMFHEADLTWHVRAFVVVLTGLSAIAPAAGVMALALLLPMAFVAASLAGWVLSTAQISDACVLAVVSGASLRLTCRGRADERLRGFAMAFGAAVLTSALVEVHTLNVIAPQRPVWTEVWHHLTVAYWNEPREFPLLHLVYRWLAGLVLAVVAERVLRASAHRASFVVRLWIVGGLAGACLTAVGLVEQILVGGLSAGAALGWVLHTARLSVLQPDLNAAGSYFALFLFPAAIVGWRRRDYWMLIAAVPLLTLACGLARSRAAIGSMTAVAGAWWSASVRWPAAARLAMAVVVIPLAASLAFLVATSRTHAALGAAAEVRIQMARVAWRTAETRPTFGVGLDNYIRRSRRFITPDMTVLESFAPNGENAHNNYLQILVELGMPAALLFVAMVGTIVRAGWVALPTLQTPELEGMTLGLLAFLVSALFGHPLLVPEVFAAFMLALGITAGLAPGAKPRDGWQRWWLPGVAAFYLCSLAWRLG
jgi:O-antigen ligase